MLIPLKKHVSSACCDKQHVCAYPQPFYAIDKLIAENNYFLGGTSLSQPCAQASLNAKGWELDC